MGALGLPAGVALSRREWSSLRGALGSPRRLSLAFLRGERAKLEAYREAVRVKYDEVPLPRPSCALSLPTMPLHTECVTYNALTHGCVTSARPLPAACESLL